MTTDELNAIVKAVMDEMEKAGVDFDFKAETPQADDLVYVMRGTADNYQGITVKWQNLLDIIVKKATDAKDEAVSAKDIALQTFATIQGIESNVSSMKSSVETTKSQVETMKASVEASEARVTQIKAEAEQTLAEATQTVSGKADKTYVDSSLATKADITYVDGKLANKADKSELAVERARIDSLSKLSEGSTTGDAELIDLRIGADGVTYGNAGTAVRTQISELKGDIVNLSESVINEESFSKTSNTSGYTYGRLFTGETQKFFAYSEEIKNLDSVVYFDSTKYAIGIYYYDGGNEEKAWYTASPVVLSEIGVANPTFRVQVRKVGYTDVDLNDVCNDVKVKSFISNNIVYKSALSNLFEIRCGINRFNPNDTECFRADGTDGYYLTENGVVYPQLGETWSVSGFIPVDAGHKVYLRFSPNTVSIIEITPITWIFFDAEKNVLSSEGQVSECIVPTNAKWMRICINDDFFVKNGMISQDSPMHMYEPYEKKLCAKNKMFDEDKWDIVLPQKMRVLVGNESVICPQNIARYFEPKEMSLVDVTGFRSKFNRFILTPVNTTEFESYVMVYRGNTKNPVKSGHMSIVPTSANSGDGVSKNILIIGDSMTEAGVYTQELVDLFSSDGMHINLIGTKGNGTNRHEGRGGWSSETYVHTDEERVSQNPFLNNGIFDFGNYMSANGFSSVDYVLINLGTNDIAQGLTDDRIYENYTAMINSIKSYNPNVIIGLWLAPTRGISGANTSRLVIDQCLRSNRLLIDKFDGKEETDNIYLIPIIGLDNDFDYVYVKNERKFEIENEDQTRSILQESQYFCSETVHPSTLGYKNIAKAIYPYIKYWGGLVN